MKLQTILAQTKFQTVYGQALDVRINGEFILLDDAATGAAFDWMSKDDFKGVVEDATIEANGTLTINW